MPTKPAPKKSKKQKKAAAQPVENSEDDFKEPLIVESATKKGKKSKKDSTLPDDANGQYSKASP